MRPTRRPISPGFALHCNKPPLISLSKAPDYYERQRDIRRQIAHHIGKLGALGFEVTLCRIPDADPDPGGTGNSQAA